MGTTHKNEHKQQYLSLGCLYLSYSITLWVNWLQHYMVVVGVGGDITVSSYEPNTFGSTLLFLVKIGRGYAKG